MKKDLANICLSPKDTLKDAISILNTEGSRIILVVDKNFVLQGTITDGDIRRSIMKNFAKDLYLFEFMNSNPFTLNSSYVKNEVLKEMNEKGLLHVPILDSQGKVIDLLSLNELISQKNTNTVFLLSGGLGTRLHPLTNDLPKPMIKIQEKPILEIIIREFKKQGFSNFIISTYFKSEKIIDYFDDGKGLGVNIKYVTEQAPLGTAGSLSLLNQEKIKSPLIVMNSDIITKLDFNKLLSFHNENGSSITGCIVEKESQIDYGLVSIDPDFEISNIEEKPIKKFFINAGIYVLNKDILNLIEKDKPLGMDKLLEKAIAKKKKVSAYPIHEYWIDIGKIENLNQAIKDFS